MKEITPEAREALAKFQTYQQQLQSILIQKESLKFQSSEIDRALDELSKTTQKNAYKITGQIMILKPVEEIIKELKEAKENIKVRADSFEEMEKRIMDKLKEIQQKLRDVIK